jgi:hypothetical protein
MPLAASRLWGYASLLTVASGYSIGDLISHEAQLRVFRDAQSRTFTLHFPAEAATGASEKTLPAELHD